MEGGNNEIGKRTAAQRVSWIAPRKNAPGIERYRELVEIKEQGG